MYHRIAIALGASAAALTLYSAVAVASPAPSPTPTASATVRPTAPPTGTTVPRATAREERVQFGVTTPRTAHDSVTLTLTGVPVGQKVFIMAQSEVRPGFDIYYGMTKENTGPWTKTFAAPKRGWAEGAPTVWHVSAN